MTKHIFTESNLLEYAEWDDATEVLSIKFNRGHEYKYEGVPKDVFEALTQAKSAGSFFSKEIKSNFKLIQ